MNGRDEHHIYTGPRASSPEWKLVMEEARPPPICLCWHGGAGQLLICTAHGSGQFRKPIQGRGSTGEEGEITAGFLRVSTVWFLGVNRGQDWPLR